MLKKYRIIIIIIIAMIMISTASGLPEIMNIFNSKYGTSKTRLDSCNLCHNPDIPKDPSCVSCHASIKAPIKPWMEKSLNQFGKDLKNNLKMKPDKSFKKLENMDSDNDGIPNIDEIRNKSFPGNRSDKPIKKEK